MRNAIVTAILWAFVLIAGPARAEMWQTYEPSKHVWSITRIRVDPNRIDDYLNGLRKSYLPAAETAKKNGSLVNYRIMLNHNSRGSDANVVILEEYSSWEAVAPNKERDLKALAEYRASLPKEQAEKMGEDYNKYRSFLDEGLYWSIEFAN